MEHDEHMNETTQADEPESATPRIPEAGLNDLPEFLQEACARMGWTSLTPVQARTLPYLISGRDVMVQSRTGTGKTGAYVLPLFEKIDVTRPGCQALVLVPTRELARQVIAEAQAIGHGGKIKTASLYGGASYTTQLTDLRAGAQFVVGTPGRVLDHLLKGALNLDHLSFLVLDEADRMLSMGFYPDMKAVQGYLPRKKITTALFSATYPPHVKRLAGEFLHKPQVLSLSSDHMHVTEVEHVYYKVPGMKRDRALIRILEMENPASAIIFCNTKANVHYVTVVLKRFGYDADELSSDLSQGARDRVLGRVRKGDLRFLVATDVAARGIDIPELSHVIQYEPPEDPEVYIHRAGRTGRAGASGQAIILVDVIEELKMRSIARQFGVPIEERDLPGDDDVQELMSERAIALLEAKMRTRDLLQKERQERFGPLAKALGEDEELRPLMAMLLDEFYQSCVSKPVAVPADTGKKGKDPVKSESRKRPRRRPRKKRPAARKEGSGSASGSNQAPRNQQPASSNRE
ncbi:DEAD/DEAH box helicase [Desulfoplanes formicivorans]|uniref:RNA helicase n=2 Tax=Desulfoplanes formicivorans TaxID=1592317 RepID=A0A194ABB5_9BACT|nr:DEAD/DEAH box helicase [Desulfoplanes formicivorans]